MADWVQGLCLFPGIRSVKSARYALQHGVTPGYATITCAPQANLPAYTGPLTFAFGNLRMVFPDFLVDQLSTQRNDQGEIYTFQLFDRRWRWAYGHLSGHYNLRMASGKLDPDLDKTPQELAELCLLAMGERRGTFDVAQIPNQARPEVMWDHDNPAQALAQLVEDLGCRVVLRLDSRVQICRTGFGGILPFDGDVVESNLTINPPERPDSLLFVAGPTSYQFDARLRAVGKENDSKGTIKFIDDLSYKPAGGWSQSNPPHFSNVDSDYDRALAKETVFRWYEIDATEGPDGTAPFVLPGYGAITWLDQLLPIDPFLNDFWEDEDDREEWDTALVFGTYSDGGPLDNDTDPFTLYVDDFDIDGALGIVKFKKPVYRALQGGPGLGIVRHEEAELYISCTCQVHDVDTWAVDRFELEKFFPGPRLGTGARVVKTDDVYLRVTPEYDNNYRLIRTTDNKKEILREADYRLRGVELEYQTPSPFEVTYRGLRPINPDGAIQSVTWEVSDEHPGARTRAARNDEFTVVGLDYKDRRRAERSSRKQIEKLEEAAKLANQWARDKLRIWRMMNVGK